MRIDEALQVAASVTRLRRSQWHSEARIRARQAERLGATLAFALRQVPWYRRQDIDITRGTPADWLARFPILTKRDLQTHDGALLAEGMTAERLYSSRTSGSTGEPTVTWFDRPAWFYAKYALKVRRMLNCGLGPGTRVLIVSEASEEKLQKDRDAVMPGQGFLFRQAYLSLHEPLADHVREIQKLRPHAIYGFPSYFSDLLEYCERHDVDLGPIKVVFTSSEVISASLRRRLGERLGARVCDVYGCTEFKEVAWECEAGRYHVNHESVWIETDPAESADVPGALLLTTLINRAAPLIRYRVGDLGRLDWGHCACGRHGPALSALAGREVDLLKLPDGRHLSPYLLTTAVEDIAGLSQYQFVQTKVDCLEMRFTALAGCSPDPRAMQNRLTGLLDGNMQVRMAAVDAIPRTPGGKRRVFVRDPALIDAQ